MMQRGIIISGSIVYLAVLASVLFTGEPPVMHIDEPTVELSRDAAKGLPYRGVAMTVQRVDWIDEYKKSIDEIASIGADTVLLVIDTRQENGKSSRIYLDMRITPTNDQLGELIDHAKKKNLRVILMPIVLLDHPTGNEWRGTIHPDSWDDWWASYRDMINFFAMAANVHHADVLVVGSELVSTEPMLDEWTKTIRGVREIFKGNLTYSSNWDHYEPIQFWDQLDLVAMNSYWKLGDSKDATVPEIIQHWKEIQKPLRRFISKVHKPLLFTEVGWFSQDNVAYEPWDYTQG